MPRLLWRPQGRKIARGAPLPSEEGTSSKVLGILPGRRGQNLALTALEVCPTPTPTAKLRNLHTAEPSMQNENLGRDLDTVRGALGVEEIRISCAIFARQRHAEVSDLAASDFHELRELFIFAAGVPHQ